MHSGWEDMHYCVVALFSVWLFRVCSLLVVSSLFCLLLWLVVCSLLSSLSSSLWLLLQCVSKKTTTPCLLCLSHSCALPLRAGGERPAGRSPHLFRVSVRGAPFFLSHTKHKQTETEEFFFF